MPGDAAGRFRRGAASRLTSVAPDSDDIALVVNDDADVLVITIGSRDDPDATTAADILDIDHTATTGDPHGLAPADAVVLVVIVIGGSRWPGRVRRRHGRAGRRDVDRRRDRTAAQRLSEGRSSRDEAEACGQDEATGQHGRSPDEASLG